jgi:glucose/arabinose dehydrogenase
VRFPGPVIAIFALTALMLASDPSSARAALKADVYVSGLSSPVAFVQNPASANTQYVVQQGGQIRIIINGVLQATDFLDVSSLVSLNSERGLLGLAFPPDHAATGRFYINYTNVNGDTVIARYKRSTGNPMVADPATAFALRWPDGSRFIAQPYPNHNGGTLAFGPDGYLYIGMGDGGGAGDPQGNAQNPNMLLGKMLRIDVGVSDADPVGYAVPGTNPFRTGPIIAPVTWAFGVRNPWKFSFDDPAHGGTGALVIGDVGQNLYEEIDYEPAAHGGRNYGWRNREGMHDYDQSVPPAYTPLTEPVFEYPHDPASPIRGISIIGGYVYRGVSLGLSYNGRYFFADLTGRVWSLGLTIDGLTGEATASGYLEHTSELGGSSNLGSITAFGQDANDELYVVSYSRGIVFRISPTCPVTLTPASASFDPVGGGASVGLTIPGGCSWTAASNAGFVTVTGGFSGTGSGTVSYTVASNAGAPNATTATRQATLTIADHSFTVAQAGCSFAIAPTAGTFGSAGGAGFVDVATPATCPWTATNLPAWASTTSGGSGAGSGRWTFQVAANAGGPRTQTVAIAGRSFALTELDVPTRPMPAGTRSRFDLADASGASWSSLEAVARRSYCGEIAAAPTEQSQSAPSLRAFHSDGITLAAGGAGATRACFIATADETILFKASQADGSPRGYVLSLSETTLWADWFYTGADYSGYVILRNTSTSAVNVTITWRGTDGAQLGSLSEAIPAAAVRFYDARTYATGSAMGSVEIAHDGDPQALVGSATTLSPTAGLSFDVLLRQRTP